MAKVRKLGYKVTDRSRAQGMDIQAISDAATIAVACAMVFLVAARCWHRLLRVFSTHPNFADSVMSEAAQRFRDQLHALSRKQSSYLGALLVFVVMYVAATVFQGPKLFAGYPEWQLYLLLATLVAAAAFASYRILRTLITWRQVSFMRDANIAIGHQLQRLAATHGRAYHDVPTTAGVVDHVFVGHDGVYAINVIAKRPARAGNAHLLENEIHFSNSKHAQSIVDVCATVNRLQKDLGQQTGHSVRVRSVIAIPGWDISEQSGSDHLLVNERTLPMITGWKDQGDYLMNEDLNLLQEYLTQLCKLTPA